VENAAKGGGVYPEVLFQVAKYWYELYMRVSCWLFIYLFIVYLTMLFSNSNCIVSNERVMAYMNDELERIWRETSWPNFKALSWNLPGGTEENYECPESG
jgi:hypothetical protein